MQRSITYPSHRAPSIQINAILISCFVLGLLASNIGCHDRAGGSQGDARQQSQEQVPILDASEHQKMLADAAALKVAWAAGDDSKVQEICGTPDLGANLNSTGFVARKAMGSTSDPEVLLQYKIARVPVSESEKSIVYATFVSSKGTWVFLNFAMDPKFSLAAFGTVEKSSNENQVLIDATDLAVQRFQSSGVANDNTRMSEVPFFAATQRITQPNVEDLGTAIKSWNRKPNEIRICRRVYVEVASGEEATYADPFFENTNLNQTVVLAFSDGNGEMRCVEGFRELRLVLKPSDADRLKANKVKADKETIRLLSKLFSASDLREGFGSVGGFSIEKMETIIPFAMKAYQQRQRVYKNESRMEISKLLGSFGEHSRAALPLLAKELTPNVLADSEDLFDATLDSISQIVGATAVIQQLRESQNVEAWRALVKLYDCDRILKKDDFDRLVDLLETDDLQLIKSKLNEMATGRVSRRKRAQIETALEFVND